MKIQNQKKEEKLIAFRELYEGALAAYEDVTSLFERHMEQYRGSDAIDGSTERALTVRNITYEMIESQISSDIPYPKVDPTYHSDAHAAGAAAVERLCASLRSRLPFESMNDIDERYTYIYGASVWYVEWDNTIRLGGEVGGVRVHCISPASFIPQPGIYDIGDMEYCFLRFTTTRSELMRKYGVSEDMCSLAECEYSLAGSSDMSDTVAVIICFFRGDDGEIGQFVFSGELVLSDIPSYYRRKRTVCKLCGQTPEQCSCHSPIFESENELYEHISASELPEDNTRFPERDADGGITVPYHVPDSFPIVIRKNISTENSLYGQSDCAFLRPEQQAINKVESRILQKLLRAGVTPVMPEDAGIVLNNSVFGQIIKMRPGEDMSHYGKVDTTPDISQDIEEADRLYEHAKRNMGISDAFQGIDMNTNESGVAKQLRIAQATGRLESKKRMKQSAYAKLDRIIFEHYLAFSDEVRTLYRKDAYGKLRESEFKRSDFIEYDKIRGSYYYDDAYLFSVDLNDGGSYQREALWQRNLENLTSGSLGNKEEPTTLLRYWQCQERAHYPYAKENVEYFKDAVDRQNEKFKNTRKDLPT